MAISCRGFIQNPLSIELSPVLQVSNHLMGSMHLLFFAFVTSSVFVVVCSLLEPNRSFVHTDIVLCLGIILKTKHSRGDVYL